MRMKRFFGILSAAAFFVFPVCADEKPLASERLIQALVDEVSGEIAYRYTGWIANYDRIQASEGWREAADVISRELESIGYENVEIEGWPSNGSRYYYTYKTPIGWRARSAELWMMRPDRRKLCSFEEMPLTLVKHSHSADVEADLVNVGTGVGEAEKGYRNDCSILGIKERKPVHSAEEKEWSLRVPIRSPDFVCPLQTEDLVNKVGENAAASIKLEGYQGYEALNFVDGKHSVLDIARAVSAEYGPVNVVYVGEYFKLLEQAGLLKLESRQ